MGVSTSLDTSGAWECLLPTDSGRSSPERGGGPPKVVEGHGRSRVTYKGQETPRVPPHHASHGPPPPKGAARPRPRPTPKTPFHANSPHPTSRPPPQNPTIHLEHTT